MDSHCFRFKVGDFSCVAIRDGDDYNRNVVLVNTGQHQVLIDTGNGDATTPPGLLLDRLQEAGIAPTAIDVVILSHADFDHIGGTIDAHDTLAFPHARYILAQEEWDFWAAKPERLPPSAAYDEDFRHLGQRVTEMRLAQLRGTLELVPSGTDLVPGVRSLAAPGHTPGYTIIAVSSGADQMLVIGDVIIDPTALENPDWVSVFDYDSAQGTVTRQRLLTQAVRERTLLMAYHLPFPGLGYVTQHGRGWRWRPLEVAV